MQTAQADVRELALGESAYDIIVAAAVFHRLREDEEWSSVFRKCYAALRPRSGVSRGRREEPALRLRPQGNPCPIRMSGRTEIPLFMVFDWSEEKNEQLRREQGVSFEEVVVGIEEGNVLDILEHPNQQRYGAQRLYVLVIDDYAWVVPFVDSGEARFLKTAFPSRKLTRPYLPGHGEGGRR